MAKQSLTHRYIPRIERKEQNLFMEEYYSSTDTKIFMDNEEQTEIGYISYSLQEQLLPIYGYASNVYDDIAVGNRIVTGAFKVPIKNPEHQSSLSEIVDVAKDMHIKNIEYEYNDFNEKEQMDINNIDWIGNTNKTPNDTSSGSNNNSSSNTTNPANTESPLYGEDDTFFEYRNKIMNLGYDVDLNSTQAQVIKAIKQIQKDNGLEQNGKLDSDTKQVIDEQLKRKSENKIFIPRGTKVYTAPNIFSALVAPYPVGTSKDMNGYVLSVTKGGSSSSGMIYVMLEDDTEGYIDLGNNPSILAQLNIK